MVFGTLGMLVLFGVVSLCCDAGVRSAVSYLRSFLGL